MDLKLEAFSYFLSNVQYYAKVLSHISFLHILLVKWGIGEAIY